MRRVRMKSGTWLPMVAMGALLTLTGSRAGAQCAQQLAMSGQTKLACVDVDGNGILDSADCCLTGFADLGPVNPGPSTANLCLTAAQGSSTPKIRGCQSEFYSGAATLDRSAGMGDTQLFGLDIGSFFVRFGLGMGDPPPPPGAPVDIDQVEAFKGIGPMSALGSGQLGHAGGLALQVILENGMMVQFGSSKKQSGGIEWQCFLVPLPLVSGMMPLQLFDLCVPVGPDGNAILALAGSPTQTFIKFPFAPLALPAPAPAITRAGLVIALLALMVIGGVRIRRWIETP